MHEYDSNTHKTNNHQQKIQAKMKYNIYFMPKWKRLCKSFQQIRRPGNYVFNKDRMLNIKYWVLLLLKVVISSYEQVCACFKEKMRKTRSMLRGMQSIFLILMYILRLRIGHHSAR